MRTHGVRVGLYDEDVERSYLRWDWSIMQGMPPHPRSNCRPQCARGSRELGERARRQQELGDEATDNLFSGDECQGHATEVQNDTKAQRAAHIRKRDGSS